MLLSYFKLLIWKQIYFIITESIQIEMIRLDTVGLNYVKHISKIFIYSFMYLSKIYNRRSILQMTIYSSIFLSIYLFIYVWAPTFFWHVCICICTITSRLINSLTYILIYMFLSISLSDHILFLLQQMSLEFLFFNICQKGICMKYVNA